MIADRVRQLFDYNYWANHRLFDKAAALSNEQFVAPGRFPHGGVRDTLTHLLFAEWIWHQRLIGHSPRRGDAMPQAAGFDDIASLRAYWDDVEEGMQAFLAALTNEQISSQLAYSTTMGKEFVEPVADILFHVVIHGMQHRSELAQMLTEFGHTPGDIDYIVYKRELAAEPAA